VIGCSVRKKILSLLKKPTWSIRWVAEGIQIGVFVRSDVSQIEMTGHCCPFTATSPAICLPSGEMVSPSSAAYCASVSIAIG